MKNEIILKKYDIDYSFIISHYLDPQLWDRQWTLFVYKDTKVTLNLESIRCRKPVNIEFRITVETHSKRDSNCISYDLSNGNLTVLQKQINSCIKTGIDYCEKWTIEEEDGYRELDHAINEEQDRLREIAEEYLDENNITLDDVREAYIDRYVSDNAKGYTHRDNYVNGRRYIPFSDLWLVFAKITDNEDLYNNIVDRIKNSADFENIMSEMNTFIEEMNTESDSDEYEEYMDNMRDNLVGV